MKRICVFCGASTGALAEYSKAARELGRALVEKNHGLVFGGGGVGLMKEIAESVLELGGEVIGVITRELYNKNVAYTGLPDLRVVESLHERKALMAELSDGFIAMPGGYGTIEEFFEVLAFAQLGIHKKPCGLLNVSNFYDKMIEFLDHAVSRQFIKPEHHSMIIIEENPEELLKKFEKYEAPAGSKVDWILQKANKRSLS